MLLDGTWRGEGFSPNGERMSFEGCVPGCVHTDLLACGKLKDLFWRDQAKDAYWIEDWNWTYEKTFTVDDAYPDAELIFEGLDTYANIYLNGVEIGQAENMFIPHAFAAKSLKAGENTLRVVFRSPIAMTKGLPENSAAFTCERLYTRRLQCTYSWDWVDRFVTMGIFRSVYLHHAEHCEVKDVRCETRAVDAFGALLFCHADFSHVGSADFCRLTLQAPDGTKVYEKRRRIVENGLSEMIDVMQPQLWWPNGYGDQPLYRLTVRAESETGDTLDERQLKVGIRTARILQEPDLPGSENFQRCLELKKGSHVSGDNAFWDRNGEDEFSGFTLVVNGVKVFCKGANWVPCEPFPSAESPEKIRKLLEMLKAANGNMVRIWGGGLFEQDVFYDICDELGLMVTQDFLMACGSYPEWDDRFLEHLRKEAEHAARKLRNHASLMWWTGDNENAMDADEDMADYHGRRSALRAIGPVLEQLDPNRPFLPSSPYGGRPYGSITRGTTHNTNYIGEKFSYIRNHDMQDYRRVFESYLSRFCAEEPIMGMPSESTLLRFMTAQDLYGEDEAMMRFHTKNNPAEAFKVFQIYDYIPTIAEKVLGKGVCPEDKLMKLQYIQYEWIRMTMEIYRRSKWFSSGMIYWMLNDCWPANGWAIIDYYARPKAAWYGFRRTSQPVIASIDHAEGKYQVYACSDGHAPRRGKVRLFLQSFDREEPVCEACAEFSIGGNESAIVLSAEMPEAKPGQLLIAEIQGEDFFDRTFFFEKRPQDCCFPGTLPVIEEITDHSVTLRAEQYVHAVSLDGEMDFEDNFFSMLPGESKTVRFNPQGGSEIRIRALNYSGPSKVISLPAQTNP